MEDHGKPPERLLVGPLEELKSRNCMVMSGADRPIAVFYNGGTPCAVDNRCPHMGFPLSQGSCQDGMVLCPWHHARFDARSGCTFDLFAGDVAPFDVFVESGKVYVSALPRAHDALMRARRRLTEGLETSNSLVIAKAILDLLQMKVECAAILREGALYGAAHRDGWGGGLTSLAALGNLLPLLNEQGRYLALFQGLRRVSADCAGQASRRHRYPLETSEIPQEQLDHWLQNWIRTRHRDAAERTFLTAVTCQGTPEFLARLLARACLVRTYADNGHPLDFGNKLMELLDSVGWEYAMDLIPTQMAALATARGAEEQSSWRQPLDLVELMNNLGPQLLKAFQAPPTQALHTWVGASALAEHLLVAAPKAIGEALLEAVRGGASLMDLAQSVAYAAALRIARFGKANETGDWLTALHTFSYCHAMHCIIRRTGDVALVTGVVHGAFSIYQDRFLNVPPAHLPPLTCEPATDMESSSVLCERFLSCLDGRGQDMAAAELVARYVDLSYDLAPLKAALALAVLREDADFHTIQMLEAGLAEADVWPEGPERRNILLAIARYLAAFSPTQRVQEKTAGIAWRLHRGDRLFDEGAPEGSQ